LDLLHHDVALHLALRDDAIYFVLVLRWHLILFKSIETFVVYFTNGLILLLLAGNVEIVIDSDHYLTLFHLSPLLGPRDIAQLSLKRVNSSRMTRENLKQTLHIDDHPIVEDVHLRIIRCHVFSCSIFKLSLHILFNLLAAPVFFLAVLAQDSIDSLFDRRLVALFADLDNLTHDDVLKLVFCKIDLLAEFRDLLVGHYLLLDLTTDGLLLFVTDLSAFVILAHFGKHLCQLLLEDVLSAEDHLGSRFTHKLVPDLFRQRHDVIKWDRVAILDDLQFIPVKCVLYALVLASDLLHATFAENL